jgi:glycosyltransferase involved in cell wall biosynthesis
MNSERAVSEVKKSSELKPLISVIIPLYNKAPYLRETLLSVVQQEYEKLEIIAVNDASTDDPRTVVYTIKDEFPEKKIKFIDLESNRGISEVRNIGVRHAAGEYIVVLDGDDIMLPGFISKAYTLIQKKDINLVSADVELFGAASGEWIPDEYSTLALRYNNLIPTLVMYRKELFEKAGGYRRAFPFNEDWEFFIRCSKHNLLVERIREKLFKYRVTKDGLAEQYIKDSWEYSVSLMITSNPDLYPDQEVLWAHSKLENMFPRWVDRFEKQLQKYPEEWLLHLWIALGENVRGDADKSLGLLHLIQAIALTHGLEWQPIVRLINHNFLKPETSPELFSNEAFQNVRQHMKDITFSHSFLQSLYFDMLTKFERSEHRLWLQNIREFFVYALKVIYPNAIRMM